MDLFQLLGTISIDNSNANKALDETSREGEKTESKLKKAFSAVGKGAVAVGKVVGTGLAVAGTAMGGLTMKALSATGELEQNMGGSEAVFSKHATKMQEKAKSAYASMGLSTSNYLATANKMGSLFKGAGFEAGEAADMTSAAMQRAADVASIMGISTESAMESIAGAAKGNFTMMDNLGVAMNDTTLQAYALEKGIDKTTQEMTNQEKIGLAMQMFMEKTADYAGNYSKENATLAGSLGTAKAALTNFLDGSGDVDQLVTAFSGAANSIVSSLKEIAPRLVSGITDIINQVIPMLPPMLQELLPVIVEGAVSLINGLVAALPAIISALMAALPALIEGFQQIINALIQALPSIIQSLVSALPTLIPMLVNALVSIIVTLCGMLPQIIQPIINYLPAIIISIVNAVLQNLPVLIQGLIQLVLGIVAALPQIIQSLVDALPQIVAMIVTALLQNLPALIQGFIQLVAGIVTALPQIFASLIQAIPNIFKGIWEGIKNVFAPVGEWFGEKFNVAKEKAQAAWSNTKQWASDTWGKVKDGFSNVGGWFKEKFQQGKENAQNAWSNVKQGFSTAWKNIQGAFSNTKSWFKQTFSDAKNNATNAWSDAKSKFSSVKEKIVGAFSNVKEKLSSPFEKAKGAISKVADKIKGFFKGEISMPKIKLPHFSIKPSGWKIGDLLEGSIPKLGIDWYAKGGIMKEPTLFDYNPATGRAKVGGEAGDEAIAPIDTLQQYVRAAVQGENTAVIQKLERIIELLVKFFPEMVEALDIQMYLDGRVLVAETAPAMNTELGKIAIKKGRGR